ncbi:MAG: surface-adhesin E family protein [Chakrabartia godavariana]
MRRALLAPVLASLAAPAFAQALVVLGENESGRQILVDVTSLRASPPVYGSRDFTAMQVYVEMRSPAGRGSVERVRYSFDCRNRTLATLTYYRVVNGRKSHDWIGADIASKYEPVAPGSLVEQAMIYACNGGKLPKRPVTPALPGGTDTGTDGDEKDGDGS